MNTTSNKFHNLLVSLADLTNMTLIILQIRDNPHHDTAYVTNMTHRILALTDDILSYMNQNSSLDNTQLTILTNLVRSITFTANTILHPIP